MPASATILIVNFDSGAHLAACLDSVGAHAPDSRVIVVDNASRDGSESTAAARGPRVTLVRNTENVGFARAVNQACALTTNERVLLLNPDCILEAGCLDPLSAELDAHPECAIAAPRVLNEDGTVQGSVRGHPNLLTGVFGRTSLLTRLFPNSALARRNVVVGGGHELRESRTADWVSGACMLVRRRALDDVGGFDARYFLYWEDADLCRRLAAVGYTIRYVPTATVAHSGGGSSRSVRALAIRAFHRSAYLYYSTHVARGPWTRLGARLLLAGRCGWKLLAVRLATGRHA